MMDSPGLIFQLRVSSQVHLGFYVIWLNIQNRFIFLCGNFGLTVDLVGGGVGGWGGERKRERDSL